MKKAIRIQKCPEYTFLQLIGRIRLVDKEELLLIKNNFKNLYKEELVTVLNTGSTTIEKGSLVKIVN